jgi:hypothetical protein
MGKQRYNPSTRTESVRGNDTHFSCFIYSIYLISVPRSGGPLTGGAQHCAHSCARGRGVGRCVLSPLRCDPKYRSTGTNSPAQSYRGMCALA